LKGDNAMVRKDEVTQLRQKKGGGLGLFGKQIRCGRDRRAAYQRGKGAEGSRMKYE